jgi:hypothetical protein
MEKRYTVKVWRNTAEGLHKKFPVRRLQYTGTLLGLLHTGLYSDAVVVIGDNEAYKVHQFVFRKSLETNPPTYITKDGFELLLQCLYNGNPDFTEQNITGFIIAATYYGVDFAIAMALKAAFRFKNKPLDELVKFEKFLRDFNKNRFVGHEYKYFLFNRILSTQNDWDKKEYDAFANMDKDLKTEFFTSTGMNPCSNVGLSWSFSPKEFPDHKIISDTGDDFTCHKALFYTRLGKVPEDKKFTNEEIVTIILHVYYTTDLESKLKMKLDYTPKPDIQSWYEVVASGNIFTYVSDFDKNGLFYYLGTQDQPEWTNPHDVNKLKVKAVSGFYNIVGQGCKGNNVAVVVNRESNPNDTCCTKTGTETWFVIDLLEGNQLQMNMVTLANHYSPQTYSSDVIISGSNDETTWIEICKSTNKSAVCYSLEIKSDKNDFFRYFKFASGKSGTQLLLGGMEMYGEYHH